MMHLCGLVFFIVFLPGGARRSLRILDSYHDSQQLHNARIKGAEVSVDAREALLPGVIGIPFRAPPRFVAWEPFEQGRAMVPPQESEVADDLGLVLRRATLMQGAGAARSSEVTMGRGDKRTKKGKRFAHSFGNTRPRKSEKAVPLALDPWEKEQVAAEQAVAEKAAAEQAAAEQAAAEKAAAEKAAEEKAAAERAAAETAAAEQAAAEQAAADKAAAEKAAEEKAATEQAAAEKAAAEQAAAEEAAVEKAAAENAAEEEAAAEQAAAEKAAEEQAAAEQAAGEKAVAEKAAE